MRVFVAGASGAIEPVDAARGAGSTTTIADRRTRGSVWSFVHIENAARATVAALTAEPGVYNVVDDDPSPVSRWLPEFAR